MADIRVSITEVRNDNSDALAATNIIENKLSIISETSELVFIVIPLIIEIITTKTIKNARVIQPAVLVGTPGKIPFNIFFKNSFIFSPF